MNNDDFDYLTDNKRKRVQIQNQPEFSAWLKSLKPHARQMIEAILGEDLTPEWIDFAQQAPHDEWMEFQFLRIIGGGNRDPHVALSLTNLALDDILIDVTDFGVNGV